MDGQDLDDATDQTLRNEFITATTPCPRANCNAARGFKCGTTIKGAWRDNYGPHFNRIEAWRKAGRPI